jgi:hypothetical protein
MPVSETNRQRYRAILISRAVKDLFLVFVPRRWCWRWLFYGAEGTMLRRPGEICLADLREFAFLDGRSIFHPDAMVMARREGRREVGMRIINYLNLDETTVQTIMEIDDGLG